jgi:hypothetical protein
MRDGRSNGGAEKLPEKFGKRPKVDNEAAGKVQKEAKS